MSLCTTSLQNIKAGVVVIELSFSTAGLVSKRPASIPQISRKGGRETPEIENKKKSVYLHALHPGDYCYGMSSDRQITNVVVRV